MQKTKPGICHCLLLLLPANAAMAMLPTKRALWDLSREIIMSLSCRLSIRINHRQKK